MANITPAKPTLKMKGRSLSENQISLLPAKKSGFGRVLGATGEHGDGSRQADVIHASDSEGDDLEECLSDPKMLFRRNSDVRKCVSIRRSVRRDSASLTQTRENFQQQRRFSSPGNAFDLSKSISLGRPPCSKNVPIEEVKKKESVPQFQKTEEPLSDSTPGDRSDGPSSVTPNDGIKDDQSASKLSRVELLLNNSLFKKHLSKHADLIQKHTSASRRYGLRKAVSNLDISCVELDQAILSNVTNTVQNVDKSEKVEEKRVDCSTDENSPSAVLYRRINRQQRRTSLSCMDVSTIGDYLSSSLPNFKENPKRKKVHIPSFEEYRKIRNFASGNWKGAGVQLSEQSNQNTESSKDSENSHLESSRGLDPITEDLPCETESEAKSTIANLAKAINELTMSQRNRSKLPPSNKEMPTEIANIEKRMHNQVVDQKSQRGSACAIKGSNSDISSGQQREDLLDEVFIQAGDNASNDARVPSLDSVVVVPHPNETDKITSCKSKGEDIKETSSVNSNAGTKCKETSISNDDKLLGDDSLHGHIDDCEVSAVDGDLSVFSEESSLHPPEHTRSSNVFFNLDSSRTEDIQSSVFQTPIVTPPTVSTDGTGAACRHSDDNAIPSQSLDCLSVSDKLSADVIMKTKATKHGDSVLRSTSDVSMTADHKKRRDRKERPYKSDPFSCSDVRDITLKGKLVPFQSTPKKDWSQSVLSTSSDTTSYQSLEELQEDEDEESEGEVSSASSSCKLRNRLSNVSTTSTDSGVIGGGEGFNDRSFELPSSDFHNTSLNNLYPRVDSLPEEQGQQTGLPGTEFQNLPCPDCNPRAMPPVLDVDEKMPPPCPQCAQLRGERKETIQEIIETEMSYGRDLNILKNEFYVPMKTTGLLTTDQLDTVFLNLNELIQANERFLKLLQTEITTATNNNEENLSSVCIGSIFTESSSMFLAFENYCISQAQASWSLEQLEKDKELLHVFLQASQRDNSLLRRMHLKSFLMVPVQRIMKYPLLLSRLYKSTPCLHKDKENIKLAQNSIELNLEHINNRAKFTGSGSFRIKRKRSRNHGYTLTEKSEVNKVALEVLGWNIKEVTDLITSHLMFATPTDHTWAAKKCKNLKFAPIHGVLLTLGQHRHERRDREHNLVFPKPTHVQQAAVVLMREKNGRLQAIRDPLMLDKCVVTVDPDYDEVFELHEWGREAMVFKAEDPSETRLWVQHLKQQTRDLGQWRRRRNALPNIMIKNLV